ncbi:MULTISPECIES: mandelate racemase/muconate lactonizing enzyme family protein [unclassified Halomonas]|uniref:mandelate racemase/muconate lactonizing enzyme family protein n=1 Tax=unclassified Halomonas TaxID=2609666 RepID=UPI0020A03048|nr:MULTISPECIES: mandelate racemase/muconate lactonizing enzyme family protein [unclassified Halomonas]MCP1313200.1 mandelate racemase/muconate lactonizing enzyme family protein [Halomonas sp. 707D7]MCP1325865.1 mandelate racemase/muconate lactonizing enzyme family protein [Halomonas sp. 707D4]
MSIIKDVKAITVSVPLDNPTSFSSRLVLKREYALVEITSDSGHKGIGFCYGGSNAGGLVTQAVRELLRPVLLGEDTYRVEGLWQAMYQEALLHGRTGSVMRAISIIDTALWDHNARAVNLPLYKLLGAHETESVPAYASGGYYLEGKTPKDLGNEMRSHVDNGFKAVKLKVGRESLAKEEARLAAVREAVGPDVRVMMDANNAWRDLPSACEFMRMAESYDPYWIEEPFSPDDIDNHQRLAERTFVPVATGEIEAGRWRFKELLDKQAAMILQTDAAVCGGITEFRRITATAVSYGVDVCPHWFHDLHVHLVASSPNAPYVEHFGDDQVLNFRRLIDTQLKTENGRLLLPKTPGLGFDFDAKTIANYAVDEWQ